MSGFKPEQDWIARGLLAAIHKTHVEDGRPSQACAMCREEES